MANERDFKGIWIDKTIWLDERLNALDKVILAEIDSLDMGEKGCYASNEHIANFCQCSATKVSTSISKLKKLGYIYVQNFDGRKRELKSRLSNFERQDLKNCKADIKNLKESNTVNNTSNNTTKVSKKVSFDELIDTYSVNEELRQELKNHLATRKSKKATLTNRAIELSLKKLDELVKDIPVNEQEETKIKIVQQSIERGWTGFFEVKEAGTKQYNNKNTNWFDVIGKEEGIF